MNYLYLAINLWSFRKELFYVGLTFFLTLLLPFIAVIALTSSGIQEASDQLAQYDAKTNTVRLYYPNGTLYKEITVNVTWPVHGVVTNEFGETHLPYYLHHSGIDIASKKGDTITPFMPGKVTYAGEIFWGFGKHVIVDHGDNISSVYGHLDKITTTKDKEVKPGDVIGLEGSTGWSTGTHLHFQINVFGIPINPRVFMGEGNPN
jgi:murein DD-endopeptidase MepM/ murein hydrolase activator NlpD